MNVEYRELILNRSHAAVGAARAVMNIRHKGLKGQLREILIRDLFRPLLPADVELGTGEIISANNCQSRQQDIVIFDKRILPPILLEGTTGIFPIESVLYTVEVKSKLTAHELRTSHKNATELLDFDYLSGEYDERDNPIGHTVTKVISTIFAFDTDLASGIKSEVERYNKIRGAGLPAIRRICVVNRGCWHWHIDQWKVYPQTYPLAEVVGFVAGIMNTYRKVAATRKEPRLGHYLIDV